MFKKTIFAAIFCGLLFSSCTMLQPTSSSSDKTYNGGLAEMEFGKKKKKKKKSNKTEKAEEEVDLFASVDFQKTKKYQSVLAKSVRENKPVFVDFYADWCAPCKIMDERVFTDKGMVTYLNDNFINYKVDVDEEVGKELSARYSVTSMPTLLFVDGNGTILVRKEGAAFHTELRKLGDEALAAMARRVDN